MQWNPLNMVLNLFAEVNIASIFPGDLRSGIALVFSLLIALAAFYMGRAIPRMMVEGKKLLELISGVVMAVVLFWVAKQSLDAASWGTILLLVSVVVGVMGVYLGRPVAGGLRIRSDTWRYVFGLAVFGSVLIGFSFLSLLQSENDAASADKGFRTFGILIVLTSFSYLVARLFVDRIRAPEYTWKIALILTTLSIGVVEVAPMDFKFGVDLKGGVNLIYQLKPEENKEDEAPIDALIQALSRRINPGGTREMVLRAYGSRQIEIIIPDAEESEIIQIKKRITQAGLLQFRIVANRNDHETHIERAEEQEGADNIYDDPSLPAEQRKLLAQWVRVARDDEPDVNGHRAIKYNARGNIIRNVKTNQLITIPSPGPKDEKAFDRFLLDQGIDDVEVLMAVDDGEDILGGDLGVVRAGVDQNGAPTVDFSLRGTGIPRFKRLTSKNRPDEQQGVTRQLGIVLDNDLLSAPTIQSVISERGQITGNFTREEINFLVGILRAGRLPATLEQEPISENKMGAELGEETIRKGKMAIGISLAAVVVFIIVYYRFAGVVAVVALATNLLLILALMKLINAAFTLPGLAGLVLTVGMSVDANVLIFERIREELTRGSSLRMAIRNGFSRATITIVDANLTTLITAIVLYMIGTDQIRGFAITLILGILMSMYTAIFCSRAVFELLEKSRLLKKLPMRSIVGKTSIDFIGKRALAAVFSVLIVAIGVGAVYMRGNGIYAIDFLGGTSVTLQLKTPKTDTEVTGLIETALADDSLKQNLLSDYTDNPVQYSINRVDIGEENTVWRVDTSIASSDMLKDFIQVAFVDNGKQSLLSTYQVDVNRVEEVPGNGSQDRGDADEDEESNASENGEDVTGQDCFIAFQDEQAEEEDEEESSAEVETVPPVTGETSETGETGSDDEKTTGVTKSSGTVHFSIETSEDVGQVDAVTLREMVKEAAESLSIVISESGMGVVPEGFQGVWEQESTANRASWTVTLQENVENTQRILQQLRSNVAGQPYFHSSSTIGGKVAGDTKQLAVFALLGSLFGIVAYIWFRFQRVAFGLAAVVALVHDVLITLGAIAVSKWVAVEFLQMEEFRISLPVVAAFLTIIGYSLNDTIVVFDRIREVRGKNPAMTKEMINESINQTLSRTLLTSVTTLIVVMILFFLGGQGIHGFAFSLVVGVLVGTYSSIFIASPVLLFLVSRKQ
ncbi:MAG: protein translocase subunit SecD [Planctomycetota bacterium]|nr:protein translocase subunit SecD [Planctomycetota bacterium]